MTLGCICQPVFSRYFPLILPIFGAKFLTKKKYFYCFFGGGANNFDPPNLLIINNLRDFQRCIQQFGLDLASFSEFRPPD
jgi:hypothetical protein